jgi:hypothetical protein
VGIRRIDDGPIIDYGDMDEELLAYPVTDDYFRTLGIALREGRTFQLSDVPGGAPVAVINETAAHSLFPGTSALGHRIAITHDVTEDHMAEMVGVVSDVRYGGVDAQVMPGLYLARRQVQPSYGTIYVHTSADPPEVLDAVRREVAALEPDLPLFEVATMAERSTLATARTRIVLGLFAAFAATGLLLSAVGLYGTVSYAAVRRYREMGLRLALGAAKRDVLRLVLTPATRHIAIGAIAGVTGALALTRLLTGLLFEVQAGDPAVLASATALLIVVALGAAWIPASRATRVDPARTLRE